MNLPVFKISEEFTNAPGPRYKYQGPYSAEELRDDVLLPWIDDCLAGGHREVIIDLAGTYGYAASFLEELFGGIVRSRGYEFFQQSIRIVDAECPFYLEDVERFVREARRFNNVLPGSSPATFSLEEVETKFLGSVGDPRRDAYEEQVASVFFGKVIKNLRLEAKVGQESLAQKLHCTVEQLQEFESGQKVTLSVVFRTMEALNVRLEVDTVEPPAF